MLLVLFHHHQLRQKNLCHKCDPFPMPWRWYGGASLLDWINTKFFFLALTFVWWYFELLSTSLIRLVFMLVAHTRWYNLPNELNFGNQHCHSPQNTICIIRFSLIVMEFNILQEKTVIFLTKYSRKVNNWNSINARQPAAEWNGFEFLLNACLTGSRE